MTPVLTAAGWRRTPSGRWLHPSLPPGPHGRRRLFTEGEALTIQKGADDLANAVQRTITSTLGTAIPRTGP